jgi:hypothetical protein
VSATPLGLALLGLAAVTAAIFVIGRAVLGLWRFGRRIQDFLADWFGEPARGGRKARKGVPERLADLEADVAAIRGETRSNGGSSMWDAVDDIRRNTPGTTPPPRRAYRPPDDEETDT